MITPAQCRAARALIGWTQDDLAQASQVARQTVIDFEAADRQPVPNNRVAIASALEARGVEFIGNSDADGPGVGVRFRKVELEYSNTITTDGSGAILRILFRGRRVKVKVPEIIFDDMGLSHLPLEEAATKRLPVILMAIERAAAAHDVPDRGSLLLTHDDFSSDAFR